MKNLAKRIRKGEAEIAKARAEGRDVGEWEARLAELKREAEAEPGAEPDGPPRAWVIETVTNWATGQVRALHLCSAPLETHLWVLADPDFIPPDDDPIFYEDELEVFKTKTIETMREILKVKRAFPRSRVIQ